MPPVDLPPEVLAWLAAAWLFAFGAAVGSFLNVVVYRLPAGMSIVAPGSHCPKCKHPIRWYDNVPIVSWFALRGRCRDCAARIAPRYPAVEATVAGLFLLLAVVELLSAGANLPARPASAGGRAIAPGLTLDQVAGLYAFHLLLLCTLLAAALIEHDGHRPPASLFAPAAVVGLLAPLVWPHLHPVPAWAGAEGPLAGLLDAGAGMAAGLGLGWLLSTAAGSPGCRGVVFASGCVGLLLGWQAAVVLVAATALGHVPLRLLWLHLRGREIPIPATAWLGALTLGWILAWGWLVRQWPILG